LAKKFFLKKYFEKSLVTKLVFLEFHLFLNKALFNKNKLILTLTEFKLGDGAPKRFNPVNELVLERRCRPPFLKKRLNVLGVLFSNLTKLFFNL